MKEIKKSGLGCLPPRYNLSIIVCFTPRIPGSFMLAKATAPELVGNYLGMLN
jgi:hypothetical protein